MTRQRIAVVFTDPNKELDMENDKLMSMLSRLFFFGALVLLGLAIVEKGLQSIGQGLPMLGVSPASLLSWTVPPLLFVMAILLREIREELKRS